MKQLFLVLFLFSTAVQAQTSFVVDEPIREKTRDLRPSEIPETLYHWLPAASLRRLAEAMKDPNQIALKKIGPDFLLAGDHAEAADLPGLFATENPVTGIGANMVEMYARFDETTGEAPRLIVMKLKRTLKAALVYNRLDLNNEDGEIDIREYDLIQHVVVRKKTATSDTVFLKEWIILNPDAVARFSANPRVSFRELTAHITRMERPGYKFDKSDVHVYESPLNILKKTFELTRALVEGLANLPATQVPTQFRRTL